MSRFAVLIVVFWCIGFVYWLAAAIGAKRNRRRPYHAVVRDAGIRIACGIAGTLLLLSFRHEIAAATPVFASSTIEGVGVAVCGIGIAIALWARVSLGRNWGMPTTVKADPELVSRGPYAAVRHPIYAGILLATLGSALAVGPGLLVVAVVLCLYFVYCAVVEERLMTRAFPGQYPNYRRRTKRFIPFIV
jgi:protein-S-isoprenylcysteine O-methyltransferase Ste14